MTQTFGNQDKLKMMLSGAVLVFALYSYFDFILGIGDLYPDMFWDEIVTGFLGCGLVLIWLRFVSKR